MTPVLNRLLLVALASASILLARKALRQHDWPLVASAPGARPVGPPQRWAAARPPGPPSWSGRAHSLPTFYQVRWLGQHRAAAAGEQ